MCEGVLGGDERICMYVCGKASVCVMRVSCDIPYYCVCVM